MDDQPSSCVCVSPGDHHQRLDRVLAAHLPALSRTRLKALIQDGQVSLDGAPLKDPAAKVSQGQTFHILIPPPEPAEPEAEDIPLDILHEDDQLLVINKPAGMVVHPAAGHSKGTLVNALLGHCRDSLSGIGGVMRPGIVHRLDKDTSGLMVAAKTDRAHRALSRQLADRSLSRIYQALVWETPVPPKAVIDLPLGRSPKNRLMMAVRRRDGREARTHYRILESLCAGKLSLLECRLESGRTHQIRVHMQAAGHPLVGDPLYGAPQSFVESRISAASLARGTQDRLRSFPRQALHAARIRFIHPKSREALSFEAPRPRDMDTLLESLRV